MKELQIQSTELQTIFPKLRELLDGELRTQHKEYDLDFDNESGRGHISGISFKGNIDYIAFDFELEQDLVLKQRVSDGYPLYFAYCSNGELLHSFGENGREKEVQKYQTGIFSNSTDDTSIFTFKKGSRHQVTIIAVNTQERLGVEEKNDFVNHQLRNVFDEKQIDGKFSYVSSFNLKIQDKIRQLNAISKEGVVRNLMMKGMVHVILAMEVEQHAMDIKKQSENYGSLTKREMETIRELSEFIENYPEIQYSLKYLSKKSGLAPSKLQEGFKILHGRTVTDFIRNTRVEAAEDLIKTTDMNISEIVYSIGLTSRSYFSKIFKEKYSCSPKFYQDHQNTLAATA
ncbi:AraC family transcriptional regulator [Allomuricauda sp. d1]|uniref:helix-turn-helix domain-containing protein n=1 Tax=Allomuricauda sp. d1 TaxID=3136725 RepID=UPI0031CE0B82